MEKYLTKTPLVIFLAVVSCALWGSAFPSIKIGYQLFDIKASETSTQLLFAGIRFFISGILVIGIGSLLNRSLLVPRKLSTFHKIIVLALIQTVFQYIFFYIGLANTNGSKAAIVEAMNVFFSVLVSALIFKMEKLTSLKIIGCIIGFAGVVLINLGSGTLALDLNLTGDGFILISTVAYAFSAVIIKYFGKHDNPVLLSGYQFVLGGIVLMSIGYTFGGRITITSISQLAILLYLAFISAAAYTIWSILLKYNPVSKVAVFGFSNPLFGVILSAILLHEDQSFGLRFITALVLVCVGIIIVNMKVKKIKL